MYRGATRTGGTVGIPPVGLKGQGSTGDNIAGVLKLVGAPILLAREILKSANVIFYKKFTTAVVFFFEKNHYQIFNKR